MFPSDSVIFRLHLLWLLRYMFHISLSLFSIFPLHALCFIISLSWTPQFPLDPILLSSLRLLRSRTRILLWRIWSLVYIFRVLVLYNLRTNITCLTSYLSEVPRNARKLRFGSGRLHLLCSCPCISQHVFWWGQSIAVHRIRLLTLPSRYVRIWSDPNVTPISERGRWQHIICKSCCRVWC